MADVIKTLGQLIPGDVNTPLDARTRVSTLNDIASIQNPYVGCIFYCEEDSKFYTVRTLKAASINGELIANGAIDTYEEFKAGSAPTIGENGNWFIDGVDTGVGAEGKEGKPGKDGVDGELKNLRVEITEVNEDGDIVLNDPDLFPVSIITNKGNAYSIDNGYIKAVAEGWIIDISPFLAYDNSSEFTPNWYVFCAGGVKGDPGWNFDPDARGLLSEKEIYDNEAKGFAFLAFDEGNMYFKLSDTSADWSDPVPFRGIQGKNGLPGAPGKKGDTPEVSIADNGNWVIDGVDTGKPSRSKGANVIMSPTPPAQPFEGMIYINAEGDESKYFDLESLPVISGSTPPATAAEGTVFIMEAE